jgi:hypothetical protein
MYLNGGEPARASNFARGNHFGIRFSFAVLNVCKKGRIAGDPTPVRAAIGRVGPKRFEAEAKNILEITRLNKELTKR